MRFVWNLFFQPFSTRTLNEVFGSLYWRKRFGTVNWLMIMFEDYNTKRMSGTSIFIVLKAMYERVQTKQYVCHCVVVRCTHYIGLSFLLIAPWPFLFRAQIRCILSSDRLFSAFFLSTHSVEVHCPRAHNTSKRKATPFMTCAKKQKMIYLEKTSWEKEVVIHYFCKLYIWGSISGQRFG